MRLSVSLNGSAAITASMPGRGYLSTHLTMANRAKENDYSRKIRVVAVETKDKASPFRVWDVEGDHWAFGSCSQVPAET